MKGKRRRKKTVHRLFLINVFRRLRTQSVRNKKPPTECVVVLTFKTSDRLLKPGEEPSYAADGQVDDAPNAEESAFADIDGSYAKNEITALDESGVVKWKK